MERVWPAMDSEAAAAPLLAAAVQLLGRPIVPRARGGASDASHFAPVDPAHDRRAGAPRRRGAYARGVRASAVAEAARRRRSRRCAGCHPSYMSARPRRPDTAAPAAGLAERFTRARAPSRTHKQREGSSCSPRSWCSCGWSRRSTRSTPTTSTVTASTPAASPRFWGILTSPFIHESFQHLLDNTVPLIFLGVIIALHGARRLLVVTGLHRRHRRARDLDHRHRRGHARSAPAASSSVTPPICSRAASSTAASGSWPSAWSSA